LGNAPKKYAPLNPFAQEVFVRVRFQFFWIDDDLLGGLGNDLFPKQRWRIERKLSSSAQDLEWRDTANAIDLSKPSVRISVTRELPGMPLTVDGANCRIWPFLQAYRRMQWP
jgi:hypothetical protein